MSEKDLLEITREIGKGIREFAVRLASILGVRIERVLDSLNLARLAEIIDIKIEDGEIQGIRIRIPSETRPNQYYYVTVGIYGYKCTCEASMYRKKMCKHVIAALMMWNVINVFKFGKSLDIDKISWLREVKEYDKQSGDYKES